MLDLDAILKNVSVVGAVGKMGRGFSLLLLQEMAMLEVKLTGSVGNGEYVLMLIDSNEKGLFLLRAYLRTQMVNYAERNINALKIYYAKNENLVSNEEIVNSFVEGALNIVQYDTLVERAKKSMIVFETIIEEVQAKTKLFKELRCFCHQETYYFTHTSSIPIYLLNDKCQMHNRIIGFHCYNSPEIQKVIEIIKPFDEHSSVYHTALELAKRLKKTVILSGDKAGFVNNGFFIPEIFYSCEKVQELSLMMPLHEAIYSFNYMTQHYLLRPLGIFQYVDSVGIDAYRNIAYVMNAYSLDASFYSDFMDRIFNEGIWGGRSYDGWQKNGFFEYDENNVIKGVYSLVEHQYISCSDGDWVEKCHDRLGKLSKDSLSWEHLQEDPKKEDKLRRYFHQISLDHSLGAKLVQSHLLKMREIATTLVNDVVARSIEDVNLMLQDGFHYLYGVDGPWMES